MMIHERKWFTKIGCGATYGQAFYSVWEWWKTLNYLTDEALAEVFREHGLLEIKAGLSGEGRPVSANTALVIPSKYYRHMSRYQPFEQDDLIDVIISMEDDNKIKILYSGEVVSTIEIVEEKG